MLNTRSSLLVAAAMAMASVGIAAPAAASRTRTLGDDRTRYEWKDKPRIDPRARTQRQEITAWNAKVDAKKADKRKQRRMDKIVDHAVARQANLYR